MSGQLLFLAFAGIGSALAGFVQDDGTVRSSDGTLCAANNNGLIRMRTCDASDPGQIWEYDEATEKVKLTVNNVCWWVPTIDDANKKHTNQRVWLIRCDTDSSRLAADQMKFYLEDGSIKNRYTDSKINNYCVINNEIHRPLKMKPCRSGRKFNPLT